MKIGELKKIKNTPEGKMLVTFLEGVMASTLLSDNAIRLAWNTGQHDLCVELLSYIEGNDDRRKQ